MLPFQEAFLFIVDRTGMLAAGFLLGGKATDNTAEFARKHFINTKTSDI